MFTTTSTTSPSKLAGTSSVSAVSVSVGNGSIPCPPAQQAQGYVCPLPVPFLSGTQGLSMASAMRTCPPSMTAQVHPPHVPSLVGTQVGVGVAPEPEVAPAGSRMPMRPSASVGVCPPPPVGVQARHYSQQIGYPPDYFYYPQPPSNAWLSQAGRRAGSTANDSGDDVPFSKYQVRFLKELVQGVVGSRSRKVEVTVPA